MNWKKVSAVMLVAVMTASLAACGGSGSSDKSSDTKEESQDTGKSLVVAIWDSNQEPGLREIMDDFTAETGIDVDIQITPWRDYWTMLEGRSEQVDLCRMYFGCIPIRSVHMQNMMIFL